MLGSSLLREQEAEAAPAVLDFLLWLPPVFLAARHTQSAKEHIREVQALACNKGPSAATILDCSSTLARCGTEDCRHGWISG